MLRVIVALIMVTEPVCAQSSYMNGNDFHSQCGRYKAAVLAGQVQVESYCQGVVVGMVEMLPLLSARTFETASSRLRVCVPTGIPASQLRDVIAIWIEENPALRHYSLSALAEEALRAEFPCE